jgi:hypothetical protein
MIDIHAATNKIFDRVHRTGEEIKNDLPNWVERFVEGKGWSKVIDPSTSKPFENVGQWLVASYPLGPGMGQGRYSISYDEFIVLCDDRPKLKDLLVKHRPKGKRGGDRGNQYTGGKGDNITNAKKSHGSTSRLYIEERLQRDHPKVWKQYLNGEFKSARQAGIAAGIFKKPSPEQTALKAFSKAKNQLQIAKAIVEALNVEDAEALKRWLSEKESRNG